MMQPMYLVHVRALLGSLGLAAVAVWLHKKLGMNHGPVVSPARRLAATGAKAQQAMHECSWCVNTTQSRDSYH